MRVNAVIISRMAGSSVSTVIRIRTWSVSEYVCAPPGPVVTVTAGIPVSAAKPIAGASSAAPAVSSLGMRRFICPVFICQAPS